MLMKQLYSFVLNLAQSDTECSNFNCRWGGMSFTFISTEINVRQYLTNSAEGPFIEHNILSLKDGGSYFPSEIKGRVECL